MKRIPLMLIATFVAVCTCQKSRGATWYVDGDILVMGDGRTWETALRTIQGAIDAASDGDTVIVAPLEKGSYAENIHFEGKNIVLQSTDPLDPEVVEKTVIDGRQAGSVVTFSGTEDETCTLSAFKIRNGRAPFGAGIFGGLPGSRTHATIESNVISANVSTHDGGGILGCHGTIQNNIISGNSCTYSGGGLYHCDGLIRNNQISSNVSAEWGGGLMLCDGIIEGNTISGNSGYGGAGLAICNGVIRNNIVSNNRATGGFNAWGGGLLFCDGVISNNTIVGNSSLYPGGGVALCGATILNCIIWGNSAPTHPQIFNSPQTRFCCVEGGSGGGHGNISEDPRFEKSTYHLKEDSPCIDAGANEDWMWQAVDRDGNARVIPGGSSIKVDIGAYEFVPAKTSETWYVDRSLSKSGDGRSWETAKRTIQEGIDAAADLDTVMVAKGIYFENINFKGKNIIVRSNYLVDGEAISNTVIDGGESGCVVAFAGTEDERCRLSGFTIRNGSADSGGGILGGAGKTRTRARIEHNVITANSAREGGALSYCGGPVLNNTIVGNEADRGASLYNCSGPIRNCIIWGNSGDTQISGSSIPAFSSVEDRTQGGEENVSYCPYFLDASCGDYHLQGRLWQHGRGNTQVSRRRPRRVAGRLGARVLRQPRPGEYR